VQTILIGALATIARTEVSFCLTKHDWKIVLPGYLIVFYFFAYGSTCSTISGDVTFSGLWFVFGARGGGR